MTDMKRVVIIPTYNERENVARMTDMVVSLVGDFDLLYVDDGSPDRCGEICDELAKCDSRIRVFHKENGGQSSARNLALDNMHGEYVAFVDSDDYVDRHPAEEAQQPEHQQDANDNDDDIRLFHSSSPICDIFFLYLSNAFESSLMWSFVM